MAGIWARCNGWYAYAGFDYHFQEQLTPAKAIIFGGEDVPICSGKQVIRITVKRAVVGIAYTLPMLLIRRLAGIDGRRQVPFSADEEKMFLLGKRLRIQFYGQYRQRIYARRKVHLHEKPVCFIPLR
jgi:hypothetical protein